MFELFAFIKSEPITAISTASACAIVLYCSYLFSQKEQLGASILLAAVSIVLIVLFSHAYRGSLKEGTVKTVVVMPNNKSLRLSEDGKISLCLKGLAREWVSNENGIVSTKAKYYLGRPMKCLSIEQGFKWLEHNGATQEQLDAMRKVYE